MHNVNGFFLFLRNGNEKWNGSWNFRHVGKQVVQTFDR